MWQTRSRTGPVLRRPIPGSPCTPMPMKISSSGRLNIGSPVNGEMPGATAAARVRVRSRTSSPRDTNSVERHSGFGGGPQYLVDEDRARGPAALVLSAARCGGHIVVHQQRARVEPRFLGQHRRGVAVDDVPLVARYQQHRAGFTGDLPDALQDHLRRRCGKDVAHDVPIQHAFADEPHRNRFVPGAVADQERGLSVRGCGHGAADNPRMRPARHQSRGMPPRSRRSCRRRSGRVR